MDYDAERIFYSDQSLRAPPPKFTDPFAAPVSPPENDENGDPQMVSLEAHHLRDQLEKSRRRGVATSNTHRFARCTMSHVMYDLPPHPYTTRPYP